MTFSVDITPPDVLAGLTIRQDPSNGSYALTGFGHRCVLREWTWGERRRLLGACLRSGRLDRERFVEELLRLLVDPIPEPALRAVYACAALWLLDITPERLLPPCTAAEVWLAQRFGLGPASLERESAVTLDRWLSHPADEEPAAHLESGWKQLTVHDE